MRIVFDISSLGLMHGKPIYGGGRFLEKLATELAKSNECELFFSATHGLRVLNRTLDYLDQHREFSHVPFLNPHFSTQLYRSYHHWTESLDVHPPSTWVGRLFQRLRNQGLKGLDHFLSPLDRKVMKNVDIFYSNIPLFPWAPRGNGHLKRIININNLLPVLRPIPSSTLDVKYNRKLLKRIYPDDWVTCISQAVKNDICTTARGIDPNRIRVIYLGASEIFRPPLDQKEIDSIRKKYNIPEEPYLFCFNHTKPYKNTLLVIQAFRALLQEECLKDLSLVLAGYPLRPSSEVSDLIASSQDLEKRVVFTGFVSDRDLASLYGGALVFIYPSLYEGFGLPPLEAMQCGAPVIASNRASIPEVVGKAGIMIDPECTDELCQAVLKIYHDSEYRKKLITQSLEQAKKFSWEQCIRETLDTYRMVLNNN